MTATGSQRPGKIALVTSAEWPDLAPDDLSIAPALARLGLEAEVVIWTDAAVDWSRFQLILVRSCWDYHQDLPRWLSWIDDLEGGGLGARLCNPPSVLRWNANKSYLAALAERGIPTIPTRWLEATALTSWETLEAALTGVPWKDLVCKPAVSAGAIGTIRCQRSTLATARPSFMTVWPELVRRAPVLVQPFVPAISTRGEWSLLFFGGRFSHAVLKRPAPGDFRVQEKHGGTTVRVTPSATLARAAERALAAAALSLPGAAEGLLYARVDLVDSPAGPLLVELELTEPALFLNEKSALNVKTAAAFEPADGAAADRLAAAVAARLEGAIDVPVVID